jgi:parvulin-like peptidyl-prolyl isomerase
LRRFTYLLAAAAMFGCVVVAVGAHAQKAGRKAAPADEVVATVNGEKIMRNDIAEEVLADQEARLNAKNPQYRDRVRPVAGSIGALVMKKLAAAKDGPVSVTRTDVMNWLFEEKGPVIKEAVQSRVREVAVGQYAKSKGVKLTEADITKQVSKAIANARTQLRLAGKSDAQVLADLGYRPAMLRRGISSSLYVEKLVQKELEAKTGHPLGADDYREGRHILIKVNLQAPAAQPGATGTPPAPDPEKAYADAKAKIDAIAQEIANKAKTFEKAASESSDDPSKFREGSLGTFVRGQMVPEFEAVAFSLPVGVVSQPVRSQFGWHLIRIDRVGKDIGPADRDQAWQNYVRGKAQSLISEIMAKAKVVNKVGAPEPMGMPGMMR